MKTLLTEAQCKRRSFGSAIIAVLAILGIMFILFTVNSKALLNLSRELDAVNKSQTNHWATLSTQAATPATKK